VEATGLKIARYLSGSQGGVQQLVSRISCNEIDILFFFRDPLSKSEDTRPDDINILRVCDVHNIPLATNIATGEALIHALERGDLDWRKNMI
jgi:methylglyoxal synthase